MPPQYRFRKRFLTGKKLLGLLAVVYAIYLVVFGQFVVSWVTGSSADGVSEHAVDSNPATVVSYWTTSQMSSAIDADQLVDNSGITSDFTQASVDSSAGKAARQEGQQPSGGTLAYPLSTVGKVFFTNASGQNMVCSGTAVVSSNHNTVDTAGHCLYWNGGWVRNMIFCPQYDSGQTPYGCWAARELEVPSGWIGASPGDLHQDFGMAIVSPNGQGNLTDVVGGAGWAYNQQLNTPFYAYGYPAAGQFNGQTRQSCERQSARSWQHAGGLVISIPCNMTGGSSGGPWFILSDGNWYLNGHNDFTSSIQPGHMFSPYYDDTWYTLYNKAQNT